MKKCSKSHHHALAELNITPLLDLAFVLLVIFIITTTPIVNDLDVTLPTATQRAKDPKPDVNYVTVEGSGKMYLNQREVDLDSLREKLLAMRVDDPNLNVCVRGDAHTKYQRVVGVMDVLQQVNLAKVNLATEPFADGSNKKN